MDDAIRVSAEPPYRTNVFGIDLAFDLTQVEFLMLLCFAYLGLVSISGGVKYFVNVYRGRLGERMLRRFRYQLYERLLRFPVRQFRRTSQGEVIPIVTAEVEPLGGFIGTAFSDPIFQGGQLLIILAFIMAQDWVLGIAAIALYPLQMYLLPKLQRRVNRLAKKRVRQVRKLSDHIGESVSGINEIHVHGTGALERARFSARLSKIYWIRYEIFRRKFFIKFLNNFIDKLTPFFFLSIGGYLVITSSLSIGALLAVLAAYKDIASPWKELLTWYQQKEDVRIKYYQIIRQFGPEAMLDPELTGPLDEEVLASVRGARATTADGSLSEKMEIKLDKVRLVEPDGAALLQDVSVRFEGDRHVAVIGDAHSGKNELAEILARLEFPTSGQVTLNALDISKIPEAVLGRVVTFIDRTPYFQSGTIGSNLLYGVKQRPYENAPLSRHLTANIASAAEDPDVDDPAHVPDPFRASPEREAEEAEITGNSADDYGVNWVDPSAFGGRAGPGSDFGNGIGSDDDLRRRILRVLEVVEMDQYVLDLGLRLVGPVPNNMHLWWPRFMEARKAVQARLTEEKYAGLVELFAPDQFNENASVAENLIFGTILDEDLSVDDLIADPFMRRVLDEAGLTFDFLIIGKKLTETMIELFSDLPPGHEYFSRYSFIRQEDLAMYQSIADRASESFDLLDAADRAKLLALPFKLIPARHRLGFANDRIKGLVLEARRRFKAELPKHLQGKVAFFDFETYNKGVSFQDNLLFGKVAYGRAYASSRANELLNSVIAEQELRDIVVEIGLGASTGVAGALIGSSDRQKLALARVLLKDPDFLVLNEAMAGFETSTALRILAAVLIYRKGRSVIWVLNLPGAADHFDEVVVMKDGTVADIGHYADLRGRSEEMRALTAGSEWGNEHEPA